MPARPTNPPADFALPLVAIPRLERLLARTACVGVVGLGYVGLPLSLLLSEAGYQVTGFDIDANKVAQLQDGRSYILRISEGDIAQARTRGFAATTDWTRLTELDAILLCVPTPLNDHHEPEMSFIENTARSIAPWLSAGQLIVLESTTYPGTTEDILIPLLEAGACNNLRAHLEGDPADREVFFVAYAPEREDPGNTSIARKDVPRVIGGHSSAAAKLAAALYGNVFGRTLTVSTTRAAEMTKLLENIYRCVNIALVNELKMLAMRMGIDIWEVIDAAATKPFGFQAFYPGPGLGGHCIPIDPFYLTWKAKEYDFRTRFIELAGEINGAMPEFVVHQVARALNTRKKALNGSRVLVLGIAYKRDIDDLRESPSLTLIELLRAEGAEAAYNDPYQPIVGRGRRYSLDLVSTSLDTLETFDCVLISTDHSVYDYPEIVRRSQLVVDTRNATRGLTSQNIFHC